MLADLVVLKSSFLDFAAHNKGNERIDSHSYHKTNGTRIYLGDQIK